MSSAEPNPTSRLRDAITDGTFLPRQRLIEAELEKFLGANRLAIRQALLVLEQEGLVVREPNRGASVRSLTDEEAVEIVELRAAIEPLITRHAAAKASNRDIETLRKILATLEEHYSSNDLVSYAETNVLLHHQIVRIAGHSLGERLLRNLRCQLVSYQYHTILRPGRAPCSVKEHRAIIDAIAARNSSVAESAMRKHLESAVQALREDVAERLSRRNDQVSRIS